MRSNERDGEFVTRDSLEDIEPSLRDSLEDSSRSAKARENRKNQDDNWNGRVTRDSKRIQASAVDIQRAYRGHLGRRGVYV